jgi:glutamate/tyrosine decarboxylase-like PLP-dependent enzyme
MNVWAGWSWSTATAQRRSRLTWQDWLEQQRRWTDAAQTAETFTDREEAHLLAGYADADSWATDAHKYLNTPYDSGLAFVRDPAALRAAMAIGAAYLPASAGRDPAEYTPELSRRARGVDVWAALRALGRAGVAELVERTCRHARRFAAGLREAGYRVLNQVVLNQVVLNQVVLNQVVLNQVLVAFGEGAATRRVIAGIQRDGTCWVGGTVWQGHTALRISVSSWRTTDADVERSLAAMLRAACAQTR